MVLQLSVSVYYCSVPSDLQSTVIRVGLISVCIFCMIEYLPILLNCPKKGPYMNDLLLDVVDPCIGVEIVLGCYVNFHGNHYYDMHFFGTVPKNRNLYAVFLICGCCVSCTWLNKHNHCVSAYHFVGGTRDSARPVSSTPFSVQQPRPQAFLIYVEKFPHVLTIIL